MVFQQRLGALDGIPAVLAHCFLGHSGSWAGFVDALDTPLDALAFDLPGHGRSAIPEEPGDFHQLCAQVAGDMVTRRSVLIGHSFGAASLLRYAAHHPALVAGLVLIEPVFFAAARGSDVYDRYVARENPMNTAFAARDYHLAAQRFLALNTGSPDFAALPEPVQNRMASQMHLVEAAGAGLFEDTGGLMEPGRLDSFQPPVLLLTGAHTTEIFHAAVAGLAKRLPNAQSGVIEKAGHMAPVTHPVETARVVDGWLQENVERCA